MPNSFRHLIDYARSQLTFACFGKNLKKFSGAFGRDCFVAALLAMTMFFVLPSFAADDEMTVSVPEYISLSKQNDNVYSSNLSVTDSNTISFTNHLNVQYNFSTNTTTHFYCYVTSPVETGKHVNSVKYSNEAIPYYITNNKVVFSKNDNSTPELSVQNAYSDNPLPANNPNAITFSMNINKNGALYSSHNDNVVCLITNNKSGFVSFAFGWAGQRLNSFENTFSPHDSAGIYTATVHITTIAP